MERVVCRRGPLGAGGLIQHFHESHADRVLLEKVHAPYEALRKIVCAKWTAKTGLASAPESV